MKIIFFYLTIFSSFCWAEFSDHFKKIENKKLNSIPINHIDYIYMINLDQRPEKYQKVMEQLLPYGVIPHRFSAIYGWDLPADTLNEVGVKFLPGMNDSEWAFSAHPELDGTFDYDFLRDELHGKHFFSRWMSLGGVGCTLSHLSVLQDAYDSGYEVIWVLEDDIFVEKDPKVLGDLITKLDDLVGRGEWDVLYTDSDRKDASLYTEPNDFESDLKGIPGVFWRPNGDFSDRKALAKRTVISEDFVQIGSRMRTHSMIVSRSGMKKILDFIKENHIYFPYDHEIATIPGIKLFNLRSDVVTISKLEIFDVKVDSFSKNSLWKEYKENVLKDLVNIPGWRNPSKAERLMDFIRRKSPKTVVEIGAFGGAITYPIAKTLQFQNQGVIYSIDAWDGEVAAAGLENETDIQWWKSLDFSGLYQNFQNLLFQTRIEEFCHPIFKPSDEALSLFDDESVDFLFVDGNASVVGSLKDVTMYLPKVKEGGYILLNNAHSSLKNPSISFLMKHCTWLKDESVGIDCLFFKKN